MEIWRSRPHERGQHLRAANESIREAASALRALADDHDSTHGFLCECLGKQCWDTIELTLLQYEDGRASPTWFLISPGHMSEREQVVRAAATYWIVERVIEDS